MSEVWIPPAFRDRPYARRHFAAIVRWAQQNHPFYQKFHRDIHQPLPVITRADVQANNTLLLNGYPALGHTSGSTSMPIKVSWQAQRQRKELEDTRRLQQWYGGPLRPMKIVALVTHKANDYTLEVDSPLPEQWAFIEDQVQSRNANSLVSYPTNLERLCRFAIEHRLQAPAIQRITAMSETYDAHMDALLKQVFPNAVPVVTYSAIECGCIAIRCPHQPENYHLMAHKLGVEILTEDGLPCQPGQLGQVVITDYFNTQTTLIRYALGDLAETAVCTCGKIALPAITRIAGKMRGLLRRKDGSQMLFTRLSSTFRDSPEIRQFQVLQPELQQFTVNAVLREDSDPIPFQQRIQKRFSEEFGADAQVSFCYMDSIARASSGKYFAALCTVGENGT